TRLFVEARSCRCFAAREYAPGALRMWRSDLEGFVLDLLDERLDVLGHALLHPAEQRATHHQGADRRAGEEAELHLHLELGDRRNREGDRHEAEHTDQPR